MPPKTLNERLDTAEETLLYIQRQIDEQRLINDLRAEEFQRGLTAIIQRLEVMDRKMDLVSNPLVPARFGFSLFGAATHPSGSASSSSLFGVSSATASTQGCALHIQNPETLVGHSRRAETERERELSAFTVPSSSSFSSQSSSLSSVRIGSTASTFGSLTGFSYRFGLPGSISSSSSSFSAPPFSFDFSASTGASSGSSLFGAPSLVASSGSTLFGTPSPPLEQNNFIVAENGILIIDHGSKIRYGGAPFKLFSNAHMVFDELPKQGMKLSATSIMDFVPLEGERGFLLLTFDPGVSIKCDQVLKFQNNFENLVFNATDVSEEAQKCDLVFLRIVFQFIQGVSPSDYTIPKEVKDAGYHIGAYEIGSMVEGHDVKKLSFHDRVEGTGKKLSTWTKLGLTTYSDLLDRRQEIFGINKFAGNELRSFWVYIWEALQVMTLMILGVCVFVSLLVGKTMEGWPKGTHDGFGIVASILRVVFITTTSVYRESLQFRDLDKEKKKIVVQGDPELFVLIPSTSDVKIKSILIVGGANGTSPSQMISFINRDGIDSSDVQHMQAVQEWKEILFPSL